MSNGNPIIVHLIVGFIKTDFEWANTFLNHLIYIFWVLKILKLIF